MCGALATRFASASKIAHEKSSRLLDVDGARRLAQHGAHLLRDVHEQCVEYLEPHRVGRRRDVVDLRGVPQRSHTLQDEQAAGDDLTRPLRRDPAGRAVFAEQHGAAHARAHVQLRALQHRHVVRGTVDPRHRGRRARSGGGGGWALIAPRRDDRFDPLDGFGHDRRDDESRAFIRKPVQLPVCGEERSAQRRRCLPRQFDGGVGTGEPQVGMGLYVDARCGHLLAAQFVTRLPLQRCQRLHAGGVPLRVERAFDSAPAHCPPAGEADAIRRQDAREWMQQHLVGAEQIGDRTGMLACRAAEAEQAKARGILAVLQGKFADGVCHACASHLQEGGGERLHRVVEPGLGARDRHELREPCTRRAGIDRFVARRAEHVREMRGRNAAEHDVAVGDRGRSTAPIAGRPRVGARRGGAHLQAAIGKTQDGAAARGDGRDVDHRRLQPDAINFGCKAARDRARGEADVGRRAAHVETDQSSSAGGAASRDHADHAPRGTRQHAVHAAEASGIDQPAVALHERHGDVAMRFAQAALEFCCVTQQHRREVGVGDGRVAAGNEAEQWRGDVRGDHLVETCFPRNLRRARLVRRVLEAVHETDGDRLDAGVTCGGQGGAQRWLVERHQHLALRGHALGQFHHLRVERRGLANGAGEDVGPFLVAE